MLAATGSRSEVEAPTCDGLLGDVVMCTSSSSGSERRYTPSVAVGVGLRRSSGMADDRRGSVLSTAALCMLLRLLETDVESALSFTGEVTTVDVMVVCGIEVGSRLAF